MTDTLSGRTVIVPESRELDLLVRMLEERGATALRCPLIAILDLDDPAPAEAWLGRFIASPPDDLVLLTGEGLRRLLGVARRAGLDGAFITALATVRTITRGPKPARALHEIGLKPSVAAEQPTTDGLVAALAKGPPLAGRRVAVQLYPDSPATLADFLAREGAVADIVVPYAYASDSDEARVIGAIDALAAGTVDAIAFTSSAQPKRLLDVARGSGRSDALRRGLDATAVAAVGPVVQGELESAGIRVDITPAGDAFFMKPLVRAIEERFTSPSQP